MHLTSQPEIKENCQALGLVKPCVSAPVIAWHYTIGTYFDRIMDTGALLPTDVNIQPGERPVLWFSLNQNWEPTSRKAMIAADGTCVRLTKEQTRQLGGGLVRFGFPSDLLVPWKLLWKQANIGRKKAKHLEAEGYRQGAIPAHWVGHFQKIHVRDLLIERWDGQTWRRVQDPASHACAWDTEMKEAA